MAKTGPHGPAEVPGRRPEPHNTQRSTPGPPQRAGPFPTAHHTAPGPAQPQARPGPQASPAGPRARPMQSDGRGRGRPHRWQNTARQLARVVLLFGLLRAKGPAGGLGFLNWLTGARRLCIMLIFSHLGIQLGSLIIAACPRSLAYQLLNLLISCLLH